MRRWKKIQNNRGGGGGTRVSDPMAPDLSPREAPGRGETDLCARSKEETM
jgi:hypothetical protein